MGVAARLLLRVVTWLAFLVQSTALSKQIIILLFIHYTQNIIKYTFEIDY